MTARASGRLARLVAACVATITLVTSCGGGSSGHKAPPPTTQPPALQFYGGRLNAVPNPSFEGGVAGWSPINATLIRAGGGKVGAASMHVRPVSQRQVYGTTLMGVVGNPARGDRFRLSLWLKGVAAPLVVIDLVEGGGTSPATDALQKVMLLSSSWRRVTAVGRVRANGRTQLNILIYQHTSVMAGQSFWIDGVVLTQLNS